MRLGNLRFFGMLSLNLQNSAVLKVNALPNRDAVLTSKYRNIILSNNSRHSSLKPFCVMAVLTTIFIFHESGSALFYLKLRFYSPCFERVLKILFLFAAMRQI
jgi:hypothetical protein